ncbi:MAG: aminomethyl-transferring glycine dehydrogenase, partial [Firmicutes bacterium]|nr:aminomethyl-transferring glycine dehydrogenase [Bacillota bacterium]
KRERASSNICSNEALCALTAAVYMAAMGPEGLKEAAQRCLSNAHYLQEGLEKAGFKRVHGQSFFHEFVTEHPCSKELLHQLDEAGILGGLLLDDERILWCATEKNTRAQMDEVIRIAAAVSDGFQQGGDKK